MPLILSGDTGPSTVQRPAMYAGAVLQVVQGNLPSTFSTTSSSPQDTGLSASITPSSSSSKILVFLSAHGGQSNSGRSAFYNLVRNSTIIREGDNLQSGPTNNNMPLVLMELDSPNTTSSVTYKSQIRTDGVGTMTMVASGNQKSSIILMEIAA
jgi:hypothetical protein